MWRLDCDGEWGAAQIQDFLEQFEYLALCAVDYGAFLGQSPRAFADELSERKRLFDSDLKIWLKEHFAIATALKAEDTALFKKGSLAVCHNCKRQFGIFDSHWDECIDDRYLVVNECNELAYYLQNGTYGLIPIGDPQFAVHLRFRDERIGSILFDLRIHIWWLLSRQYYQYQALEPNLVSYRPDVPLTYFCEVLDRLKQGLENQFSVELGIDDVCDNIQFTACITKRRRDRVCFRKRQHENDILSLTEMTRAISMQCNAT